MSHATFIVYHEVPPQNQDTYERWLRKIINTAARFEGHLGVDIVQPAFGGTRYSISVKFASYKHALIWQESDARRELLEEAEPLMSYPERVAISTGIDNWFQSAYPAPYQPRRYKQWMLTTLVIWVLTMLVPLALQPVFSLAPVLQIFGVRHLVIAATIVALVIYLIMPRLSKLLSAWLQR